MKIAWLHEKLGSWGGAESNVLASALALRNRGHENHLLHRGGTGRGEEAWADAFSSTTLVQGTSDTSAALQRLQPDIVWIHNWSDYPLFPELVSGPVPVARMLHDHTTYCLRTYKYHPLTRRICQRPASLACIFPCGAIVRRGPGKLPVVDPRSLGKKFAEIAANRLLRHVVVASRAMRRECLQNGFAESALTILPPVSPEGEKPSAPPEPGRLLYVGQLIRGKGVDVLVEALPRLRGAWHLHIAGEGTAGGKLRKMVRARSLEERVTFHGHLAPDQVNLLFAQTQVVVFPSMWPEPFGLVGVEAMRRGKPVVAFDVGGVPDWLEDGRNGLLVPWGDRTRLASAIQRLLDAPDEAQKLGEAGRKMSRERFSFDAYMENLEHYLRSVSAPAPTTA